jgi:hypothetical protein
MEALRVLLNLKGTNAGHYICPILQSNLTVAQGNKKKLSTRVVERQKALKGMPV